MFFCLKKYWHFVISVAITAEFLLISAEFLHPKQIYFENILLTWRKRQQNKFWEPSKSASVKTASNEIQKTQFGQRQLTRNQNSQFQNSQNS
jgi:hypothetical protein